MKRKTAGVIAVIIFLLILLLFSFKRNNLSVIYDKINVYLEQKFVFNRKFKIEEIKKLGIINNSGLLIVNKEREIVEKTLETDLVTKYSNEYRLNNKITALFENDKLNLSAKIKAKDILEKQYFEHISPEGLSVENLGMEVGYDFILLGENLAMGDFNNPRELVDTWIESTGHRENILNPSYVETGVAVERGVFNSQEVWVIVVHFGTPKSACSEVSGGLREEIEKEKNKLDVLIDDFSFLSKEIDKTKEGEKDTEKTKERIRLTESYNKKVKEYNSLLKSLSEKTSLYNEQVNLFNSCLQDIL